MQMSADIDDKECVKADCPAVYGAACEGTGIEDELRRSDNEICAKCNCDDENKCPLKNTLKYEFVNAWRR